VIQSNPILVNKIKTFKEVSLDFLAIESNVFHFDLVNSLEQLYGVSPNTNYPEYLGKKLAHFCITMNEHPCIRYQGSSSLSRDIAQHLHTTITTFKRNNNDWWCYGDDRHSDRERAQILVLDRSFDPLTPLMHEYNYQAMVIDLLDVEDGAIVSYETTTNRGAKVTNRAILNENDELWLEFRHQHIAKVIECIKERMNDIIQNTAGAKLAKKSGADMDITSMAAAVKELPEYQQTTTKLGQHVDVAKQCMNAFGRQGLMNLSRVEQTISTGMDDDGKEVKGAKLYQIVAEALQTPMEKIQKLRLLSIYYVSQKQVPGSADYLQQAFMAARLSPTDIQIIRNFDRILINSTATIPVAAAEEKKGSGGLFSSFFGGTKAVQKIAATAEGEYTDTRHVGLLRGYVEQLIGNTLPQDRFPTMGPTINTNAKAEAKSVRRFNPTARFGRRDGVSYQGGRLIIFIAGGASYAEMKAIYEVMQKESKEIILGSTHLLAPDTYLVDVGSLNVASSPSTLTGVSQGRENLI
jgi:syntaxin-binding protein 1